jgi:hypothetical protein
MTMKLASLTEDPGHEYLGMLAQTLNNRLVVRLASEVQDRSGSAP